MLLSHEPLLNRQRTITATRLKLHTGAQDSGTSICHELNRLRDFWPENRTILLTHVGRSPDPALLDWDFPTNAMVEFSAADLARPGGADLARKLKAEGLALCVSGTEQGAVLPEKLDFRFVLAFPGPSRGRPAGVLLAENPLDHEEFETCLNQGFAGAAGWFFLQPKVAAKKLLPGHARIVHLLNLVRANADVRDIEAVLKQDVALSFRLLRYINSAGFGLLCEIQSFKHAVTILGYEKLNKWLSLLLVTASKDPAALGLMQAAIVRGRFMELVATPFFDRADLDNLFITGAFSLLDALLGTAMDVVLAEMRLPEAVVDALVQKQGMYAPFLDLAKACETGTGLEQQMGLLGITAQALNQCLLASLCFADGVTAE